MDGALSTHELPERCEAPFHAAHGYANAELEPSVNAEPRPVRSGVGGVPKQNAKRYRCIVADPPWKLHRPGAGGKSSRPLEYPTMSVDEIAALPIGAFADDVCHLYLWTVSRHLRRSYEVADAWGFDTSHATVLVWCKPPRGWECGGHYGLTTEYILFCRRGIEGRNPEIREPRSWWEWPRGRHSEKPEAFMDMVERISPAPRLELFARNQRLGRDSWGNEALNHVTL